MKALRLVALALFAWTCVWTRPALAHDFRPGVLSIEAAGQGSYRLRWVEPQGVRAELPLLAIEGGCQLQGALPLARLQCGADGLRGQLRVEGLGADRPEAVVRIGTGPSARASVVSMDHPVVVLGSEPFEGGASEGFFTLGLRHIAGGLDHLLFVALLFAAAVFGPQSEESQRRNRLGALALNLTGFTVAHSLSLAAVMLSWLPPAGPVVEAWIAASLVIAAAEIVRAWRDDRPARVGWGVVFAFGLVHGLGFAGALVELLGPQAGRWRALFAFNLGIEAGQLLFVGALLLGVGAVRAMLGRGQGVSWATWPRLLPLYAIGTVAAAWTVERTLVIFG